MKNLFFIIAIAFALASCTGEKPAAQALTSDQKTIPHTLNESQLYDTTAILAALIKADRHQKSESRRSFLKGLDLLANKNKPQESIALFKEAIYYYPDEKSFMHLFRAYVSSGDTANARHTNDLLYNMIQNWHTDYYEIDFNNALIDAARKDTAMAVSNISLAIMDGFIFKERITDEPLFKFMENHISYQSLIASNFGSDEKLNRLLFKAFVKYYPDLELPYTMSLDSARAFNYDKYIDYNFSTMIPGMNDGRFSRDVTNEYMYVGKFKIQSGFAFVYKSYLALADTLNPVKTYIVTYDSTGHQLANDMVACFCSPTESSSLLINKDQSMNVVNYEIRWESDPLEKGYAGNKVLSTEEKNREIISIASDGKLDRKADEEKKPDALTKNN